MVSVDDCGATNAHPPQVTFQVYEVLRGHLNPGPLVVECHRYRSGRRI